MKQMQNWRGVSYRNNSFITACDTPSIPENAQLSFSADNSVIEYHCNAGYTLKGDAFRQCSTNGLGWLGSEPSCGMDMFRLNISRFSEHLLAHFFPEIKLNAIFPIFDTSYCILKIKYILAVNRLFLSHNSSMFNIYFCFSPVQWSE